MFAETCSYMYCLKEFVHKHFSAIVYLIFSKTPSGITKVFSNPIKYSSFRVTASRRQLFLPPLKTNFLLRLNHNVIFLRSIYIHTCGHTSIYIHTYGHTSIYIHTCGHTSIYIHTCGHTSIYVHTCGHTFFYYYFLRGKY